MRKPILLLGFTGYTDPGLVAKIELIISNMKTNPLYSDADTLLTDVEVGQEAYIIILAQRGNLINYSAIKKDKRSDLIVKLVLLGQYVRNKYPNNVANWISSGFSVQQFDTPTQVPQTPVDLRAKDGTLSGEVVLAFDSVQYAVSYDGRCWKKGSEPPAAPTLNTTNSRKMLFTNLDTLTEYNFQVRSRGRKGLSNWGQVFAFAVR